MKRKIGVHKKGWLGLLMLLMQGAYGQEPRVFPTYGDFRDAVIQKIQEAQGEVWLASRFLSDGDVATALYAASLRKVQIRVILDRNELGRYASRHEYLSRNGVTVTARGLEVLGKRTPTIFSVDNQVWEADARLDDHQRIAVTLSPATVSMDTFKSWWNGSESSVIRATPNPISAPNLALPKAVKPPPAAQPSSGGAKIDASVSVRPPAVRAQATPAGPLPRTLPRETRLQLLQTGKVSPEPLPTVGSTLPSQPIESETSKENP